PVEGDGACAGPVRSQNRDVSTGGAGRWLCSHEGTYPGAQAKHRPAAPLAMRACAALVRSPIEVSIGVLDKAAHRRGSVATVELVQDRDRAIRICFENGAAAKHAVVVAALRTDAVEVAVRSLQQADRRTALGRLEAMNCPQRAYRSHPEQRGLGHAVEISVTRLHDLPWTGSIIAIREGI